MHRSARLIAASLALATSLLAGCGGGKFSSPEACFQAIQSAAQRKDIPAMMECLTDESQSVIAGGMVMMGSMMKMMGGMAGMGGEGAAEMQKQSDAIAAVLQKHGVTDEALKTVAPSPQTGGDPQAIIKVGGLVMNKPAFIGDMYAAMQQFHNGGKFNEELESQLGGTLKDVKINGDAATATIVTASGEDQLDFRNTSAGWKLHIDYNRMRPGAGPPA